MRLLPRWVADYGYMFEGVKGYPDELAVEATDEKTLVVTLNNALPYWNELLAFPAFFPVREDVVANEAWATDPSTYVSNGPYTMTGWDHNSKITLTKNAAYFAADTITMDEIDFYLSDDANNMLANFQNGDWQLIDDVPTSEIASLKEQYPTRVCGGGPDRHLLRLLEHQRKHSARRHRAYRRGGCAG